MHPLRELVSQSLHKHVGVKQAVLASQVVEHAERIVLELFGTEIGMRIKPLYLKNRTLTVSCANSTIAQELKFQESEILARLTSACGEQLVDRIRYFA